MKKTSLMEMNEVVNTEEYSEPVMTIEPDEQARIDLDFDLQREPAQEERRNFHVLVKGLSSHLKKHNLIQRRSVRGNPGRNTGNQSLERQQKQDGAARNTPDEVISVQVQETVRRPLFSFD